MTDSPYLDPTVVKMYEQIAAPFQFLQPARDLVDILGPFPASRVLDVGTGTGVVALSAMATVGPSRAVVGADASIEMLRGARRAGAYPVVVAHAPGLPFRDHTFDVVIASFVVSHFANYHDGLADIVRVCRETGRIGISAWGTLPNPAAALWNETAGLYAPRQQLDQAFRDHIPWDQWFSQREHVELALRQSGLISVAVETREYRINMSVADYLLSRQASVQGLVLRRTLTAARWNDFTRRVAQVLEGQLGDRVDHVRDVHFGVGTKPVT